MNDGVLGGEVDLGHAIDIVITGATAGAIEGRSALGKVVLDIGSAPVDDRPLDLAILFDRSGSTEQQVRADNPTTVWSAMRDGLFKMLQGLDSKDRVTLYDFHSKASLIGTARGPDAAALAMTLEGPDGGTEIGLAIDMALAGGARDILLLTDGRSGALDVHRLAGAGARISALLVGPDSLEAMVGHLAALTGGHLACASGLDAADRLAGLSRALRAASPSAPRSGAERLPECHEAIRGGSKVTATWSSVSEGRVDAVGAFAAALALPSMTREAATASAIAHGLCTHLTSLVGVDDAGSVQDAIPETRKVPLACPSAVYADTAPCAAMPRAPAPDFSRRIDAFSAERALPAPVARHRPFAKMLPALERAGRDIDWSRCADRLSKGDLDGLDEATRSTLRQVAANTLVVDYARARAATPDDAKLLAIAISAALAALASGLDDRSTARLLRRVATLVGEDELNEISGQFGI